MPTVSGYSEDDVDLLEAEFTRVIEASLRRVCEKTAAQLQGAIVSDASPAGLSSVDVAVVTQLWQEEIDGVLTPYVAEVYTGSATQVAVGLAESFPNDLLPGVPLVGDDFTLTYMKTVSNRLVGVGDELWEDVRNELLNGISQGQSIPQIRDRIVSVADFTHQRATVIARTEVHSAAESGSISQMRYVGFTDDEVEKEWLATISDGRTRLTHIHAHEQKRKLNEKFIVGGWPLDHPGDVTGPADEIIQCRCTMVMNFDTEPPYRCASALTSASPPGATTCVVPTHIPDITHLKQPIPGKGSLSLAQLIFNTFMKQKITPAYGGAKIHKVLALTRADLDVNYPGMFTGVSDQEMLAAVDFYYLVKKDTFFAKYTSWAQSPAGQKVVGKIPSIKAVKTPISVTPTAIEPKPLPPVAPKPNPSDIQFTGKTLGSHGAQVWENPVTGEKWLFKPQQKFLTDLDVATARIQSKALQTRPGVYEITLNGKSGSIQYMFDSKAAWPSSFDVMKLTDDELFTLQREQIFDWMISNFDSHTGQFVRLSDGSIVGVDKGQAFKFFGKDKLDWDYVPPGNIGTWIYPPMWRAFVQGKDIHLQDPTQGPLGEFIERLMSIDDDAYRDLLRKYAQDRGLTSIEVEKFLDAAVVRKNSLKTDFGAFYQRALKERTKSLPSVSSTPSLPAPVSSVTPGTIDLGDITKFSGTYKSDVLEMWLAQGGGKKVTPGWGGAKIYKMLVDLQDGVKHSGIEPATHLQLLRILDEQGGFKGKPKTYESVVVDWLKEPNSTKITAKVGLPDTSLTSDLKSIASPVVAPSAAVSQLDEAFTVIQLDKQITPHVMFTDLPKYQNGEVIAYTLTKVSGDYLRATRYTNNTIRVDILQHGEWKFDKLFADFQSFKFEQEYDLGPSSTWFAVSPKASVGKTIISGKMPGDDVTIDEIFASKNLWNDGDVIATTQSGVVEFRLTSDGLGGVIVESKPLALQNWVPIQHITGPDDIKSLKGWKLTGDVFKETKDAAIPGKSEGDVVSVIDAYAAGVQNLNEGPVAYAFNHILQEEYRIFKKNKGVVLQHRAPGAVAWSETSVHSPSDLQSLQHLTWRAAKKNGNAPDSHIVQLPGQTKISVKTPTKIPNTYDGEETSVTTFTLYADQFNDYEVIAVGKSENWEFRIYSIDGVYVREVRNVSTDNVWTFDGVVDVYNPAPTWATHVTWHASAHKVPSSSVGAKHAKQAVSEKLKSVKLPAPKAAKVAKVVKVTPSTTMKKKLTGTDTHIPGKSVGDIATQDEIIASLDQYVDGQIIAEAHFYGGKKRLFVADGHLIVQKQTSAGAWKTETTISLDSPGLKYNVSQFAPWKLTNDEVTASQLKAAKKIVAKKTGTLPTKTAKAAKVTSGMSPTSVGPPITIRPLDLSHWSDANQEEIYQFFRTKSVFTTANPESIWSVLQQAKSHFQGMKGSKYIHLNEMEILRIIDARAALRAGVADTHPYETKVVNWLKSPAGKSFVNKRIDAPLATRDIPAPMTDLDIHLRDQSIPDPDKQSYPIITLTDARKYRAESQAKYGTWNPGEKEAQRTYTGGAYTAWNEAIRKGDIGTYRTKIRKAQAGMRPSTRSMMLHRGCSFKEFNDPSITSYEDLLKYVDKTYTTRGFTSTSVGGHAAFSGQLLIEFECPVGTPMMHVADFSIHPGENETTLPAHMIYKILKVKKAPNGHTTIMRVRVIGAADPNA